MKAKIYTVIVFLQLASYVNSIYNILDFGALPHTDHLSAHFANQKAFLEAVNKANSTNTTERIVKVPKGVFYTMPMRMENLKNVTFIIEGRLAASKNILQWPKQPNS
jgi:hypothetical protein